MIVVALLVILLLAQMSKAPSGPDTCEGPVVESEVLLLPGPRPYSAVGTLSGDDGRVMQLYARPSASHRDRWNYYTTTTEDRIPVELLFDGRRCEADRIGCARVQSGDQMTATEFGTGRPLTVQLYGDR